MVVLHPLSTSNHNTEATHLSGRRVVLHPLSTSNHNSPIRPPGYQTVVLHPLSTSNHNATRRPPERGTVVLHPLSTSNHNAKAQANAGGDCCIASSFYIKPQRRCRPHCDTGVVLHPLSTSNHNVSDVITDFVELYCILFLHQTTTNHFSDVL